MWIFLALVLVPIIEIALFIEVGGFLGLWPTIAIVILTAFLGTVLLRRQGLATLADLQGRLQQGQDPSSTIAHGAMILIAGIVLLTPGFFTDAIGFLLLVPPIRASIIRTIGQRMTASAHVHFHQTGPGFHREPPQADNSVIDGDYKDVTPPEGQDTPGDSGWTRPGGEK